MEECNKKRIEGKFFVVFHVPLGTYFASILWCNSHIKSVLTTFFLFRIFITSYDVVWNDGGRSGGSNWFLALEVLIEEAEMEVDAVEIVFDDGCGKGKNTEEIGAMRWWVIAFLI